MDFVCRDPSATVRAANVRATLEAFHLVPSMGRRLVERHRLRVEELGPDQFVPIQSWLEALKEVQEHVGQSMVRSVGVRIVENADFPHTFPDAESILLALDTIYHLNHRGDVGHYYSSRSADGSIVVRCETPYPREFERGLVEGICRNRSAKDILYAVEFTAGPVAADPTCTLTVRRR
jgi:hypothetical protein